MSPNPVTSPLPRVRLGFWDTASVIVGIIIGVGIFQAPAQVFANVTGPGAALAVWVLGGLLSLAGALCYAELASTYPRSGGEYVYLTRAFGPAAGFLFAWAQLAVIRTGGSIAAVAYIFADYAAKVWDINPGEKVVVAVLAVAGLTGINILGVAPGKRTQNLLTIAKVAGLAALVLVGLLAARPSAPVEQTAAASGSFALAMIFVLYAYAGWNEAAYVAAEVENRRRNVPLALATGTAAVAVIYLLINLALLVGLGLPVARGPGAAAELLRPIFGEGGVLVMAVLVMVSALGALNGTIFTGSRLFSEMGADHRLFVVLGRWDQRWRTPIWSLACQASISIGLVVVVGTVGSGHGGFEALVKGTAPVLWLFFLLTGVALFVLRRRDARRERPFRVPFYPVLPLIFCGWSAYMLYGSLAYARAESLVGLGILLLGIPIYLLSRRQPAAGTVAVPVDSPSRSQRITPTK